MGLGNFFRSEFIDIVEWLDDSRDTLVHRFERHENEIKNGAQLIVRPGQTAVFVNEGEIADVFSPGRYELVTKNLPILSTLRGWKYGFDSPFKAEVYFVNTTQFTGLKWGTPAPLMMRDPDFGVVRVRAFGTYALRVTEPPKLICQVVGTNGRFQVDHLTDQLRSQVVSRFADVLGEGKIPVLDLAAKYDEVSLLLAERVRADFSQYGLEVTQVLIENVSLPAEVEAAMDRRSSMGVVGDLNRYTQFQTAEAIGKAAANPSSGAGEAMGMGLGFGMAQRMAQALGGDAAAAGSSSAASSAASSAPAGPPPLPQEASYFVAVGGKQTGPWPVGELAARVASGELTPQTLVWTQGMSAWTAAESVAELRPLFAGGPPPLPAS